MDRFEISVRKFAKQRRMPVKKVGKSGLRLKYGFNFLVIDVERVGDFILVRTYMPYPVRPTPRNLRLVNRLNCMFPDVKLVLDGYLRVCISRKLEPSALKSGESLDDMLLKGARWGEMFQSGLVMFFCGRHSDKEVIEEFQR